MDRFWEEEEIEQRRELCLSRLAQMEKETVLSGPYEDFFRKLAKKLLLLFSYEDTVETGKIEKMSEKELTTLFDTLYEDVLPQNYEQSYANPAFCGKLFGKRIGRLFTYLTAKTNSMIFDAAEKDVPAMVMLTELFIEIYVAFEDYGEYTFKECKEAIASFEYDNMEYFLQRSFRHKFCPDACPALLVIGDGEQKGTSYLYRYGEYITDNEKEVAKYLQSLPKKKITEMAENAVGGYLRGFTTMRVERRPGQSVQLRYPIGFERMMSEVVRLLKAEGMRVTSVRTPVSGRHARKYGYTVTNLNLQYDYDHRNDEGLYLDKKYLVRKEELTARIYAENKEILADYAGPVVVETFGERLPLPKNTADAVVLDKRQQRLKVEFAARMEMLQEQYVPSDKVSFTIVAYPLPSIGERFPEIFDETLRLNELDNETYIRIQQCMIDALNQAEYVHVTGRGANKTDIFVKLWTLKHPEKETIFENCTADVNIPVGEVFTSPVLKGTNGLLHVTSVFLNGTEYKNLKIEFHDGKTGETGCDNFPTKEENVRFIRENLLKDHDWLPLGEFAIGTNTAAYTMAQKFGISEIMPILIAEKTGPHFAIGDTCYSYSEDHAVFNPDGKEIVARENECSALRKTSPKDAYFQCHTDITIPYSELGSVVAVRKDKTEIPILENGRFVLPGTTVLNDDLDE